MKSLSRHHQRRIQRYRRRALINAPTLNRVVRLTTQASNNLNVRILFNGTSFY